MPRIFNGYYYAEVKLDGTPTVKRIPRLERKLDFIQRNAYIREWLIKELGYAEVEVLNVQG